MSLVTLAEIETAAAAIGDRVHHTPLQTSRTLGSRIGARVHLKAECLQVTGSFKVRGALNRVRQLAPDERERGVVTVSAGNHAQALAWAATAEGVPCTVVMPEKASRAKVEASRGYGAEVLLHGSVYDAFERCLQLRDERDLVFVHPFDDRHVIAGQGTVGLEIVGALEALEGVDTLLVPVGGGGLLAGVAAAVRVRSPWTRIIGVEPEGAAGLRTALDEGRVVKLDRIETVADGLAPPSTSELALAHARELVDDVILVTDTAIIEAVLFLLERAKLLVEPAGAAAVAALLSGAATPARDGDVVAILSGGNLDLALLREWL